MHIGRRTYHAADVVPFVFAFTLAIAFDPFTYTGATTPRWALMAIALPLLCGFASPNHFSLPKLIGAVFVAWAATSLIWTANGYDGAGTIALVMIIAMAFCYGARLQSLSPVLCGLAGGVAISSLILLIPALHAIPSIVQVYPHGLMGNRNMLGEVACLTALGCLVYKRYLFIIPLVPAIVWPPISRGAILALLSGICVWLWPRSKTSAVALAASMCLIGSALIDFRPSSVHERLEIWQAVLSGITFFGHGIGSLQTLMPYLSGHWETSLQRVDHAHNEFIEILFELGIPGLVLYLTLICVALRSADHSTRVLLVGFLVISCVAFPWHIPLNAFIGALVMGHAVRAWPALRSTDADWRARLRPWHVGPEYCEGYPELWGSRKV